MREIKIDAIISYVEKIVWARGENPDRIYCAKTMRQAIGEGIGGKYCSYCKKHPLCIRCNLRRLYVHRGGDDCCSGLWYIMKNSETIGEFEENATDVLQYICEEG